jgi:hypothetical protein
MSTSCGIFLIFLGLKQHLIFIITIISYVKNGDQNEMPQPQIVTFKAG